MHSNTFNPKFAANEQTSEQRQHIVEQALAISRSQDREPSAEAHAQYARYIQGELTMEEVVAEIMQSKILRAASGFAQTGN
ncbi:MULTISPECIES: antitoxin VbhA family protein [Hymenobacter]|uniref:Antitoxin VbhA family protein n=2 Tax=Hymenobacter TaxID=89966 RepID=A0ABR7MN01_9BACT|nr:MULTISPECIES: antitoxin VbhA family protein [Hymenobacter]MBC6612435.1 antitoxin VbhA family protein [Hymenobacter citatus]MBO3272280.1 hypothetical protein [Hymenobacter defluvii]